MTREMTTAQHAAVAAAIGLLGVPLREEWRGEDRELTFKIGTRTFVKTIDRNGFVR